jgi:hypothetical protein
MLKHLTFTVSLSLIAMCAIVGCKGNENKSSEATVVAKPVSTGPQIPGIPGELMAKLLNECTNIDYIFHNLPFSLNQSEKSSIEQNIGFIDINSPVGAIPADCKPIGRKFFKINSDVTYDVDVYLSGNCKFYVFVDKKNKPLYANNMTKEAVIFYSNTAQQAKQSIK